jgi:hypothetical protein
MYKHGVYMPIEVVLSTSAVSEIVIPAFEVIFCVAIKINIGGF